MKTLRYIALLLFVAAACWRCGEDEEIDIPGQRTAFEKFLTPLAQKYSLNLDAELRDRYDIYRLIIPARPAAGRTVEAGDAVTIEYYGHQFSTAEEWGRGGLFTTNNWRVAEEIGLTNHPEIVLPPEELTIRQGAGEILSGIDRGLIRAGLRDTVWLYLTSDHTYGDRATGLLDAGTPTVFEVIIKGINEE